MGKKSMLPLHKKSKNLDVSKTDWWLNQVKLVGWLKIKHIKPDRRLSHHSKENNKPFYESCKKYYCVVNRQHVLLYSDNKMERSPHAKLDLAEVLKIENCIDETAPTNETFTLTFRDKHIYYINPISSYDKWMKSFLLYVDLENVTVEKRFLPYMLFPQVQKDATKMIPMQYIIGDEVEVYNIEENNFRTAEVMEVYEGTRCYKVKYINDEEQVINEQYIESKYSKLEELELEHLDEARIQLVRSEDSFIKDTALSLLRGDDDLLKVNNQLYEKLVLLNFHHNSQADEKEKLKIAEPPANRNSPRRKRGDSSPFGGSPTSRLTKSLSISTSPKSFTNSNRQMISTPKGHLRRSVKHVNYELGWLINSCIGDFEAQYRPALSNEENINTVLAPLLKRLLSQTCYEWTSSKQYFLKLVLEKCHALDSLDDLYKTLRTVIIDDKLPWFEDAQLIPSLISRSMPFVDAGEVPHLNVCCIVAGSAHDVRCMVSLAKGLLNTAEHNVLVASFEEHRQLVEAHQLPFKAIAGNYGDMHNQEQLFTEYVASGLRPFQWLGDMLHDSFKAAAGHQTHLLLANLEAVGHVHIAERLHVPLHLVATAPATPTRRFQSPLFANINYSKVEQHSNYQRNLFTFQAVERLLCICQMSLVNRFRELIQLPKLQYTDTNLHQLPHQRCVPTLYMYSGQLLPKPVDWPQYIDVCGFVGEAAEVAAVPAPPQELLDFVREAAPPVFITISGDGLEEYEYDLLVSLLVDALLLAGCRGVIELHHAVHQLQLDRVPESIYVQTSVVNHDLLLPLCCAVVTSGNLSALSSALRCGRPLLLLPTDAREHFFASVVKERGAGVTARYRNLTLPRLVAMLQEVHDNYQMLAAAHSLAQKLQAENATSNCLKAVYKHLPIKQLKCDVYPSLVAEFFVKDGGLKVCEKVAAVLAVHQYTLHTYQAVDWSSTSLSVRRHDCIIGPTPLQLADLPAEVQKMGKAICETSEGNFIVASLESLKQVKNPLKERDEKLELIREVNAKTAKVKVLTDENQQLLAKIAALEAKVDCGASAVEVEDVDIKQQNTSKHKVPCNPTKCVLM